MQFRLIAYTVTLIIQNNSKLQSKNVTSHVATFPQIPRLDYRCELNPKKRDKESSIDQ